MEATEADLVAEDLAGVGWGAGSEAAGWGEAKEAGGLEAERVVAGLVAG